MDPKQLDELNRTERWYWWHRMKRSIVSAAINAFADPLPGPVLEVGCGAGRTSSLLASTGARVVAADRLSAAVAFARAHSGCLGTTFDASGKWPFREKSFGSVVMLDVLEHLQDDSLALHEAARVLKPDGRLILTVPAHPFLFSAWDDAWGHERRYSYRMLLRLAKAHGFSAIHAGFWNMLSLIPAFFRTWAMFNHPRGARAEFPALPNVVNELLSFWGRIEAVLTTACAFPLGLSLIGIFRRS